MIGQVIGGFVMMRLGSFTFGISTAAYSQLQRSTVYRWPVQERYRNDDALQFTGAGEDSITLSGVILPGWRAGAGQIERLREIAGSGQPQILISGTGEVMGRWIVEQVDEKQAAFAAAGIPRRQEFSLKMRSYGRVRSA